MSDFEIRTVDRQYCLLKKHHYSDEKIKNFLQEFMDEMKFPKEKIQQYFNSRFFNTN